MDLLLNTGVAILRPETLHKQIPHPEPEMEQDEDIQLQSSQDQSGIEVQNLQPPHHIHLPNSTWSTEEKNSDLIEDKDDDILISDKSDKTFLPIMDHHIEDDLLCLQTTLQTDIKLNSNKEAIQDIDIDESS